MKEFGRILVLIDNPAELATAAPLFSQLPEGWKVHVSENAADAICQLGQVHFDMVFVDLKEGPHASAQFLHEVWARHPDTIRFLLAGNMAPDLMVTCALGPHQFLQKPLDADAIRNALERASLVHCLFQQKDVQALVSRIRTFPSRPTVYVEVMKELRSAHASAMNVGELVSRDLAISAKLLQITNSAFFGFTRPVSSPSDAVLLLGMETTASLVLGIEAFSRLDNIKLLYFSTEQVWKHCQAVAHSARAITEYMTNDSGLAHESYTAALLHDIGKLALAVNVEEQYRLALNSAREQNLPAWRVEREIFGATHAEAGAYLLSLWGLSAPVIEAVACHHLPARELAPEFSPSTALHLANALEDAESMAQNAQNSSAEPALDLDYPPELGLQEHLDDFREIVRNASRPAIGVTQFVRRPSLASEQATEIAKQLAADLPPHGWWSRFRSLLAT
ncbi:MAG TPA: response regulator [Verrucomicrobiae bacterium]|nr:response regulator [Verrucomicrobiae bacterium]